MFIMINRKIYSQWSSNSSISMNTQTCSFFMIYILDHLLAFSCVKGFNIMGFYPANVLHLRFQYIPYLSMYVLVPDYFFQFLCLYGGLYMPSMSSSLSDRLCNIIQYIIRTIYLNTFGFNVSLYLCKDSNGIYITIERRYQISMRHATVSPMYSFR